MGPTHADLRPSNALCRSLLMFVYIYIYIFIYVNMYIHGYEERAWKGEGAAFHAWICVKDARVVYSQASPMPAFLSCMCHTQA